MDIVFAGTPEFALPSLHALCDAGHRLAGVYTQPDRPAGRGRRPRPSAVKQLALRLGLSVYQPPRLNADAIAQLQTLAADVIVVVAYGLILPAPLLSIPRYGCINVHASLLPRWRGAAPIARAIEAGDDVTGITIMQLDTGLDSGPILAQRETPVRADDTAGSLHDRLAPLGAELLVETLDRLTRGEVVSTMQSEADTHYARKLRKEEALLDWAEAATLLERKIRAFNPWPVAFTRFRGKRLRVWAARRHEDVAPGSRAPAGTVTVADDDGIRVQTGAGLLSLHRVQLEGGKPLDAREFINGYPLHAGERLG